MWKLSYLPTCFEVNSINYFKVINYEHHFTAGNYHFALPGITCLYKNNVTALKSAIKGFIKPVNWTRTFKLQVGITGWLLWKVTWTVWVVAFRMFSMHLCVCVCEHWCGDSVLTTGRSQSAGTRWSAHSRHAPLHPPREPWHARRIPGSEQRGNVQTRGLLPGRPDFTLPPTLGAIIPCFEAN